MKVAVTPTGAFRRDLKRLSNEDADATIRALSLFIEQPTATKLNFELVKHRRGFHSIRATYSTRILLRKKSGIEYDAVAVGNHDYVYGSYFKK